ncbi:MAG: hypothetical protein F6K19_30885 [Cyanothece sp. SIO1E1]|nr:hypothetical protein [Cyanothece sp. SIO1E1]
MYPNALNSFAEGLLQKMADLPYDRQFFEQQLSRNTCEINCEQQILEETLGFNISEHKMSYYANQRGHYDFGTEDQLGGVPVNKTGAVLEDLGFDVERFNYVGPEQIKDAISNGKDVIVSVDANELWANQGMGTFMEISGENPLANGINHAIRIHDYDFYTDRFTAFDPGGGQVLSIKSEALQQYMAEPGNFGQQFATIITPPDQTDLILQNYMANIEAVPDEVAMCWGKNQEYLLEQYYASPITFAGTEDLAIIHTTQEYMANSGLEEISPLDIELKGMESAIADSAIEGAAEGSDALEIIGAAADGVDIIEGIFTLGLGLAIGYGIKRAFKAGNSSILENIKQLSERLQPKLYFAKLLELGAPVHILQAAKQRIK